MTNWIIVYAGENRWNETTMHLLGEDGRWAADLDAHYHVVRCYEHYDKGALQLLVAALLAEEASAP